MKKLIFLKALLLIAIFSAKGTIINVDNNPNRPNGYYENLQLAINGATAGDTIYIYPSNTSYGNISVDRQLHLFGSGYDGTSGAVSKIARLYLDTATSPASNPSGSTFQGLTFTNSVSCSKPNICNIIFAGNYSDCGLCISLSTNCPGWLITNNYFKGYINLNNNPSIVISNNIFYGHDYCIYYSNSPSNVITNNLFMYWRYFYYVFNTTISNNIFICSYDHVSTYMANNKFYNNLSWRSSLNPYNIPPESNTGSGNISNSDPEFETGIASGYFDYTKDYHLKSTSPGKNAGMDGTDIGPYGGSSPFVWGGAFSIPKITETLITNPVINQSTPLNVNVKAKKAEL